MKKISGRNISQKIIEIIASKNKKLSIAALYAGNDPSMLSYIKSKKKRSINAGIELIIVNMPENVTAEDFYEKLRHLNNDDNINGIIVEKPLPLQLDISTVAGIINYKKDIDCLSYSNNGRLISDEFIIAPSTAMAVINILKHENIEINGKHVVIIGRSEIVGKPLSLLLVSKKLNNHATVTLCHSRTDKLEKYTKYADIIITAIGKANFLKNSCIGENKPILIDVGINYDNGKIYGDIDPECYEKASFYTPVPGGVGPVTVATLFENLIKLNEKYD